MPRDVSRQISHCWVQLLAPFPTYGQNMALLWLKHCPHMVLQIGSSSISINLLRDVPCQISHCWVYPVAPSPRNRKIWPFYWQNMVFTCSLILVFLESQSMCLGMLHAKFHIAGFILKIKILNPSQEPSAIYKA